MDDYPQKPNFSPAVAVPLAVPQGAHPQPAPGGTYAVTPQQTYGQQQYTQQPPQQATTPYPDGVPIAQYAQTAQYAPQQQTVYVSTQQVPSQRVVTEAMLTQSVSTGQALRTIGVALVTLGVLGIFLSATYIANVLAIAAGAVLLSRFRDDAATRQLGAAGNRQQPGCDHPTHAYNLALAIIVFSCISFLYCISLAVQWTAIFYNSNSVYCNQYGTNCAQYNGGSRYLALTWCLGVVWCIAYIALCSTLMRRLRAFEALTGVAVQGCGIGGFSGAVWLSPSPPQQVVMVSPGGQVYSGGSPPLALPQQQIQLQPQQQIQPQQQQAVVVGPTGQVYTTATASGQQQVYTTGQQTVISTSASGQQQVYTTGGGGGGMQVVTMTVAPNGQVYTAQPQPYI